MNSKERILVIEDELPMRTALCDLLESEGYRVLSATHGEEGLARAVEQRPDLILLDIMMPKLDGFSLCRELRRLGQSMPVLMLTAKGRVEDRVKGLDAGGDDYLPKPFSSEELLARVRALLRRHRRMGALPETLQIGRVEIDFHRQTVVKDGREVHLTAREFTMIRIMAEAAGEPVSRDRFLDLAWGYTAFPTTRTVDTHIASLRSKLEQTPETPRYIKTVHGLGYKLELGEQAPCRRG